MARALVLGFAMLAACGGDDALSVDAALPAPLSVCPAGNGLYVAYDGSAPGDLARIVAARPNFVVLGAGLEARSDLAAPLQAAGVRALLTIDTLGSTRVIDSNLATAMTAGWDGVFFDHVAAGAHAYNANLADLVHGSGVNKLVVMNAGQATVDAGLFDEADIVSSDDHFEDALGPSGMPAWRWLSQVSGAANADDAIARLATYRSLGGFWFDSPSGALPDWFEEFAMRVRALDAPCGPSSTLTVQALDLDHANAALTGLNVLITQNQVEVTHGPTPLAVLLPNGSYVVDAQNFQGDVFDHWDDQTRSPARAIVLGGGQSFAAYYHTVPAVDASATATLTYQTADVNNPTASLTGLFVTLEDAAGNTLDSGYSVKMFPVDIGPSYIVDPAGGYDDTVNRINYTFARWSDGTTMKNRSFTFSGDTTLVADYNVAHY